MIFSPLGTLNQNKVVKHKSLSPSTSPGRQAQGSLTELVPMNYLKILKYVLHFVVPDLLSCLVIPVIKPTQKVYSFSMGQAYQDHLSAYLWYDLERVRLESGTRPRETCLAGPPHAESSFS